MESQLISTNGIKLHTIQAGPAEGPLILLLHGFPEFWYGWRYQISPLAEAGFRVWAPDLRGYNLSDNPSGIKAYTTDLSAADVVGLIQSAGRDTATVVGHDWGGVVAWQLALRYPEMLDHLVVINIPHPQVMRLALRRNSRQCCAAGMRRFLSFPGCPKNCSASITGFWRG